jgi:hypothetical protein
VGFKTRTPRRAARDSRSCSNFADYGTPKSEFSNSRLSENAKKHGKKRKKSEKLIFFTYFPAHGFCF